jgi:mannose/fructose/N-acetylgalactosamine-specific phosphotransferase system component IIC
VMVVQCHESGAAPMGPRGCGRTVPVRDRGLRAFGRLLFGIGFGMVLRLAEIVVLIPWGSIGSFLRVISHDTMNGCCG